MEQRFKYPPSVEDAVSALGDSAVLFAGGTWVMRAPLRDEDCEKTFISLAKIPELHLVSVNDAGVKIGALVTHHALAAISDVPEMTALVQAAGRSANPAIRRMATVGGNICAKDFAAADLVPALLALGAEVEVQSFEGAASLTLEDYLQTRSTRPSTEILTSIHIPRHSGRSAHARGLLRQAGEYPVANVSVYLEPDQNGAINAARIAVGSVESTPKRWHALEAAVSGQPFGRLSISDLAQSLTQEFTPRDGVDAPATYRLRILPRLVAQAFADAMGQLERSA